MNAQLVQYIKDALWLRDELRFPNAHTWDIELRANGSAEKTIAAHANGNQQTATGIASHYALRRLWGDNNFPVVQISHLYAAALACTHVDLSVVRSPWSCFLVELPAGVFGQDPYAFVGCRGNLWSLIVTGSTEQELISWGVRLEDSDTAQYVNRESADVVFLPSSDVGVRRGRVLFQFIASLCMAMSDPTALRLIGKSGGGPSKRLSREPTVQRYMLQRPVTVDCRPTIREYLEGKTGAVKTVQWLVRGHWRNQAHGPGMQLHCMTWIEPYWKGPDDAPIVLRPHVLEAQRG